MLNTGWTQLQWEQRLQLKADLTKWSHGFYASHRDPFPIRVTTLKHLCGYDCNRLADFRRNLSFAMNELTASGAIDGWEIDVKDKVHVQKPGTGKSEKQIIPTEKRMQRIKIQAILTENKKKFSG